MPAQTGKFDLDPALRPYATPSQWEKLQALAEHGSERAAGKALGINHRAVHDAKHAVSRNAAARGYSPDHDLKQPVPDGFRLKGASTLYRPDTGEAVLQWVKSERDTERWEAIKAEAYAAFAATLPQAKATKAPKEVSANLAAVYPVGDLHLGMYSWDEEAGGNWDLSIGEAMLFGATDHLVASTPACDMAIIPFLGDYSHYDSFKPLTPTAGNLLDADSRFPKMVRASIRSMRYMIEAAARRHGKVNAIVEIGNHDMASAIWLMECLSHVYENDPRITIDTSPRHYHYHEFGSCLIGTHHGHEAKMEQLPMIMATDQAAAWGRTKFRYWYTGHIHHRKSASTVPQSQDYNGCSVESFRVLPPTDAWAESKGYRPIRDQRAIVLHKEFGEVARHTVNPAMLG
jgi:hypothetical protein